jgi:hypothetical protein
MRTLAYVSDEMYVALSDVRISPGEPFYVDNTELSLAEAC